MRILRTNWINILGVFLAVLIYSTVFNILDTTVSRTFFQSIFAALLLVVLYGMMFWGLFAVTLLILDLVLISRNQINLRFKLICEWLLISLPFIYWTIIYGEWIFIVAVSAFLLAQLMRERLIRREFSKEIK